MTVIGLCEIHNSNSNKKTRKTNNKMHTPHHTISHTHTPQEWKTSKNRWKFLTCRQTVVYITRTPASTSRHSPSVEKNTQSNVHAYFPFLLPLHVLLTYTGWREHRTIQPVWWSLRIQYHFTRSYLIKLHMPPSTSSARINFASTIRYQTLPTSYFMPMGGRRIAVPHNL